MTAADWYDDFATRQAHGVSPAYERLARAVARDETLLALLGTVPPPKRQPNLLFAVVRLLGGPVHSPSDFAAFVHANWPAVAAHLTTRATQTNEANRCALLLPVLASLPQPLALLEVGCSAGLNLYPDRYSYAYGTHRVGSTGPLLTCTATGAPLPTALPTVAWRAGIDLNPLDITAPADLAWLDALIWPEHAHRRTRLREAAAIAAADPPHLVRGDLVDALPALAASAPRDATLVVFHTSVLYQVPDEHRRRFTAQVGVLPGHWIAVEDPEVLTYPDLPPPPADVMHKNVLALDGKPLAWTRGHGEGLSWFAS
ncbi:hypothetical protein Ade02nite_32210 [Paractinoplanes deccanensis]|uniref:DUF2332 domain-containing protein n=1 Tax=Paractinoplanes deccanensis TaxID=113561 RepID=A0ABQ3Y3Y1_9ACTN|nr:DUF2332 domain-containing protein [Actinoplanes deccanensis]GID74580.1 hypothetical protein Ade02nite_32210 [Actinoplanes deccanensis]